MDEKEFQVYDLTKQANKVLFVIDEDSGEWIAYYENMPTTRAYGKTQGEAFKNLIHLNLGPD